MNAIAASIFFGLSMSFYPLAKRYTYYPQAVLGFCMNSGILIANLVISGGTIDPRVLPFYFSGILWTMVYDTVYALQDVEDDKKVGVKGLAVLWGDNTIRNCGYLNYLIHIGFMIGGTAFSLNPIFHILNAFSCWNIHTKLNKVDPRDTQQCFKFFKDNRLYGVLVAVMILIGQIPISFDDTLKE